MTERQATAVSVLKQAGDNRRQRRLAINCAAQQRILDSDRFRYRGAPSWILLWLSRPLPLKLFVSERGHGELTLHVSWSEDQPAD
jgi:hypothetical protein